jgi:hypothetical protein
MANVSASLVGLKDNSIDENDSSTESESESLTQNKSFRTKGKEYHLHETFETLELAQKSLSDELIWSKKNKSYDKTNQCHKQFYRLNILQ